jgi:hypothetical protein
VEIESGIHAAGVGRRLSGLERAYLGALLGAIWLSNRQKGPAGSRPSRGAPRLTHRPSRAVYAQRFREGAIDAKTMTLTLTLLMRGTPQIADMRAPSSEVREALSAIFLFDIT